MSERGEQSGLSEICAIVLGMLRFSCQLVQGNSGRLRSGEGRRPSYYRETEDAQPRISTTEFVALMTGISLALMLSGSATFMIGFMLMPWIAGMAMFLFFCKIISFLSALSWSVVCPEIPVR